MNCIRDALGFTTELATLIRASPKCLAPFRHLRDQLSQGSPGLKPLCPTRWTVHSGSVDTRISMQEVSLAVSAALAYLQWQRSDSAFDEFYKSTYSQGGRELHSRGTYSTQTEKLSKNWMMVLQSIIHFLQKTTLGNSSMKFLAYWLVNSNVGAINQPSQSFVRLRGSLQTPLMGLNHLLSKTCMLQLSNVTRCCENC